MKKIIIGLSILIVVFGLFVRFYQLGQTPPSLDWDEASIGYDALLISQSGTDQWGQHWPLIFKSFGEYKYPFHIYATALVIKTFGLSDLTVRLPSAIMGLVCIGLLYILASKLSRSKIIGLIAALLFAVSPWNIQFSRLNWETNFSLCLFFGGLILFVRGLKKPGLWLPASFLLFGLTIFSYNAAKVFIPLFVASLVIIYRKDLWSKKVYGVVGLLIFTSLVLVNFLNPEISGLVRFSQVSFSDQSVQQTTLYKLSHRYAFGKIELMAQSYLLYFSPQFLLLSGDPDPRHSIQSVGEIYWIEGFFLVLGLINLVKTKNKKSSQLFLCWLLIAPIAGSLSREAPHASRSMFEMGLFQVIEAIGFLWLYQLVKAPRLKLSIVLLSAVVLTSNSAFYVYNYFQTYPAQYSEDWQYGYKAFFSKYGDKLNQYNEVYLSPEYAQPYIFTLYYLKYSGPEFRSTVVYNGSQDWGFSTVKSFGNFNFSQVKNVPAGNNLIVSDKAMVFDGFRLIDQIKFLDNKTAFYIYSL